VIWKFFEVDEGRRIAVGKFREEICGTIRKNYPSGGNLFMRKPEVENLLSDSLYGY
jgi:hypothetical protein